MSSASDLAPLPFEPTAAPAEPRRFDGAMSLLLTLALLGYPLVAAVSSVVGLGDSSVPSIALRVGVVLLAIFVLVARPLRVTHGLVWFVAGLLWFWSAYLGRILVDGFAKDVLLQLSGTEYLAYATMFSLIPALGALQGAPASVRSPRLMRRLVWLGLITLLMAALAYIRSAANLQEALTNRAGLDKLNPISLGHLAVSVMLVAGVLLFAARGAVGWLSRILALLAIVIGAGVAALAGSKGPIVAMLVAWACYALAPMPSGRRLRWILIGSVMLIVLGVALVSMADDLPDFKLVTRVADLLSGRSSDESTSEHLLAYQSALTQFTESPIFGDALVERVFHFYPHNAVLEVAMATGLFGLIPFLTVGLASMVHSVRALASRDPGRWVHMLNIQYFVAALFSGGVYADSQMWFLLVLCFASGAMNRDKDT